jgi:4-hydroxy-tetrahydrodipicolinate synthase
MARRKIQFEGILPAMVTPMNADGSVDEAGLARLTERLIVAGSGGLIPNGSTGEFQTLSNAERRRVAEVVIEAAAGRVPVAPHTGALSTREVIELSQHAQNAGASGVMVVPPFYEPLPWPMLVAHYRAVAAAIDIPIIFYHLPVATGAKLSPEQIAELASIDGIDWVKDSSADAVALTELIQRYSNRIGIMNGWDSLTFFGLLAGTPASIWGAANVIPDLCVELFDAAARQRDLNAASKVWERIWPICNFLENAGSYVAAVKAGCEIIGEPAGDPRAPLLPLDDAARAGLRAILEASGVKTASA